MQPLASIRLVNLRDGMENYEYLWTLQQLNEQLHNAMSNRTIAAVPEVLALCDRVDLILQVESIIAPQYPWEKLYATVYGSGLPKEDGSGGCSVPASSGTVNLSERTILCLLDKILQKKSRAMQEGWGPGLLV